MSDTPAKGNTVWPTVVLLLLSSAAHAQVVVGDNIRAMPTREPGSQNYDDTEIWLWTAVLADHSQQSPCALVGCWGYVGLAHDAGFVSSQHLLYGGEWRAVEFGDIITADSLGSFPLIAGGFLPEYPPVFVGDDFYLGFTTTFGAIEHSGFGWVHLRDDAGTLRMVDNAIAYGAPGIVVGTTQVVPEPTSLWPLGFLLLLFWLSRRKHH